MKRIGLFVLLCIVFYFCAVYSQPRKTIPELPALDSLEDSTLFVVQGENTSRLYWMDFKTYIVDSVISIFVDSFVISFSSGLRDSVAALYDSIANANNSIAALYDSIANINSSLAILQDSITSIQNTINADTIHYDFFFASIDSPKGLIADSLDIFDNGHETEVFLDSIRLVTDQDGCQSYLYRVDKNGSNKQLIAFLVTNIDCGTGWFSSTASGLLSLEPNERLYITRQDCTAIKFTLTGNYHYFK